MTANASSGEPLPLIGVKEHKDPRLCPRVYPEGMIGMIRFAHAEPGDTYHFVGLDISQSGAAILMALEGESLPSMEGEISIYLQRTALHRIPFRIARTRQIGAYIEIGLTFKGRLLPMHEIQAIAEGSQNNLFSGLAGEKVCEILNSSKNHEEKK